MAITSLCETKEYKKWTEAPEKNQTRRREQYHNRFNPLFALLATDDPAPPVVFPLVVFATFDPLIAPFAFVVVVGRAFEIPKLFSSAAGRSAAT
jgi:hypothetical protein